MDDQADVDMSSDEVPSEYLPSDDPADIREFTKKIVEKWKENFEKGCLTYWNFRQLWRHCVPKIYSPSVNETCLNWNFKEDLAQEVLFNTLDDFICNGESATVLKRLGELDKASSVCGKVFKFGEPTYSCRECGMDKTCVLCIECFKNSAHRLHKYKMGTSSGGGCCDCGDVEAWKSDPFCKIHAVGVSAEQQGKTLPDELKERTKITFEAVLGYAYNLLSIDLLTALEVDRMMSDNYYDVDTYCTILYNDEVHTFDQVINTLTRVLKCNQRNSTEYVTNIDREGRAIVKCSNFQHCTELKLEIEKFTSRHGNKPLRVLVSHTHILAHQIYAMKLLVWLEKYLVLGEGFRKIFSDIMLKSTFKDPCMVKGILQKDSSLWKSARTQWHRLLISGMLLEYESKQALAKIFTRNYGSVMKDFIKDDHDHTYSISSLSVQLFTVPTLAHHLIAHDDVLYHLLNTLISECSRKCNKARKLEFERSPNNQSFKRALFMLYDLKYLLNSVPENWTDDLRKGFLHGLSMLLSLLTMMQGMDAVTRQVGQHMEYEPEWESGFNLHIKLAYCISLAIEWCGTDKIVLIKAYRSILKKLEENPCYEPHEAGEPRELADHSTACLHYDVSSRPVSIHLPLTRFLAALHLYLEKFNLNFDGQEFQNTPKPTPVQIMEPVLRAQVMVAQVHAGMWRRNGYALLNTLFFYHNVKCRTEMLDRDITLLQMAASLIESNEFLIHILNKFNLINWAMPDFEVASLKSPEEDSIRQVINLVEELLQLLIVIIGERYMPGVSNCTVEDRIRKEIIQHLCIKPLPHSELTKTIPDDLTSREVAVDEVIQELAVFKKPAHGTGRGVYELKENYFEEFNVFFYHYTREELSKADESQRKRRHMKGELECCPPPKLPKLTESFAILVNLLQCDVMLHLMQTILERCENLRARSYSESQLSKVLHLIGYALLEEESHNYPFFKFIENSSKFKIFELMEQLLKNPRVDSHKGLLQWTLNKYKQVANKKDDDDCVMIVQASESTSEKTNTEKERRAKLAAERRAKLMAQIHKAQKNFIKENASLFASTSTEKPRTTSEVMDVEPVLEPASYTIALGKNQSTRVAVEKTYVCILCQEEEKVTAAGPSMVLAAFVQQATVLCQHKDDENIMDVSKHDPLYLHSNLGPAPHTSTCGHVMHSECWRKYFDNVMVRERRRPYRLRHPASFDVDKQEFLCPLCECLSNTVLPLVPPLSILQQDVPKNDLTFSEWVQCIWSALNKKQKICHGIFKCDLSEDCKNLHCNACIYSNGTSIDQQDNNIECEVNCMQLPHQVFYSYELGSDMNQKFKELFPMNSPVLDSSLKEMIQVFAQIPYTRGLNVNPHPSDKRLAPMNWKCLAYTIHSIEVSLRDAERPLLGNLSSRQRDCIESFIRIVSVLGSTLWNSVFINSHAISLLTMLFEQEDDGPSILEWDSFGLLVSLTFSIPSLSCKYSYMPVPTGGTLDHHLLTTIFFCHIVKIIVLMKVDPHTTMMTDSGTNDGIFEILKIVGKQTENVCSDVLLDHIKTACLPFLRCCVLFYHYLTEVPATSVLSEYGGDTFENMCAYLDLPQDLNVLFDSPEAVSLVKRWCSHEEVAAYLDGAALENIVREPLPVPHLIDLPSDYSELINTVSTFDCPNSKEDSKNPSLCLVCGKILCSQSYCCQTELNKMPVGACNYHANKCGSGIGIFLRVRECEVLFLATPHRGCFMAPPYLDDYGETDQGLRRGNPLRLCAERYKKLQTLWLSHGVHEEIARSIETNSHIGSTQWNLL